MMIKTRRHSNPVNFLTFFGSSTMTSQETTFKYKLHFHYFHTVVITERKKELTLIFIKNYKLNKEKYSTATDLDGGFSKVFRSTVEILLLSRSGRSVISVIITDER